MRTLRLFPAGLIGGFVGWQAAKAILMPVLVWSSTAAGTAAYVNWVVQSHRENARMLEASSRDRDMGIDDAARSISADEDLTSRQIAGDLATMVAARTAFLRAYDRGATSSDSREAMIREDVLMLEQTDKLRQLPADAVGADVLQQIETLRRLDDRLRAIGAGDGS